MADQDVTIRITAANATQGAVEAAKRVVGELKQTVQRETQGIRSAFSAVDEKLGAVGLSLRGLGAAAIGAKMVQLGREAMQAAGRISDLSAATGASVQGLQRLEIAGRQVNVSLETAARGVQMMQRNLASGDAGAVAAVQKLGLEVNRLLAMKPDQAFEAIARAIAKNPDPAQRTALAMEALGKSGAQLLPLLTADIDKLTAGTIQMTEKGVKGLDDLSDAWDRLTISIRNAVGESLGRLLYSLSPQALGPKLLRLPGPFDIPATELAKAFPTPPTPSKLSGLGLGILAEDLIKAEADRLTSQKAAAVAARDVLDRQIQFHTWAVDTYDRLLDRMRFAEPEFVNRLGAGGWSDTAGGGGVPWVPSLFGLPVGTPASVLNLFKGGGVGSFTPPAGPGFGQRWGGALGSMFGSGPGGFMNLLGPTVLQSLMGGGSITGAVGSLAGGALGSSLSKALLTGGAGSFGQSGIGKLLGGMLPGLGSLLGPGLDALFGWIGSIGKNVTKGSREDFAQSLGVGNTTELWKKLRAELPSSQAEELINRALNVIGKKDEKANTQWMADVTKALDAAAVDKAKNSWQNLLSTAERFGISVEALGPKFQGAKVKDTSLEWVDAFNLLVKNGADFDAVLAGMTDEAQEVVNTALKFGVQIPAAMRPFLEILIKQGKLLGANGEALTDLSGITFDDSPLTAGLDRIGDYLKLLLEGLGIKVPDAIGKTADAAVRGIRRVRAELDGLNPRQPTIVGGDAGGGGVAIAGGGRVMTPIVVNLGGREVARVMAPALTEEFRTTGSLREPFQDAVGIPTSRRTRRPTEA